MIIRKINEEELKQAIAIKIVCWTEELAGVAENDLSFDKEYAFWLNWMRSAEENNDVRLLIGAFEDDEMLGIAFGSFAETFDIPENGVELNGLWVDPVHRNKGVSLALVIELIRFYKKLGMNEIVIYNPHLAPSNAYYKKFGAEVVKQETQMDGLLPVDVFIAEIDALEKNMTKSLRCKYASIKA